jgi:hypothetical protein
LLHENCIAGSAASAALAVAALVPRRARGGAIVERAKPQLAAAVRAAVSDDAPAGRVACLGLESLPARIARLPRGMIYSLACDQQAVRLPLAARALGASLRTGQPCVLVTAGDPAMFLRKARLAGMDLGAHARSGELALFQLAAEADKSMFRDGPQAFLRELELSLPGPGVFVVLDEADAVFALTDPRSSTDAAKAYVRWAATHQHTVLALFAPSAMAPREYLALRRAAENFAGFAVARATYGGGTLDVRHWFTAEGASPREVFDLRLYGESAVRIEANPTALDELPPVDTVICVGNALPANLYGWRDWQDVASAEEGLQALRRSAAATLVLPFRHSRDFPSIAAAVAAVRSMGRPELHVAVRECGRRLRAGHSLALMRRGLSTVIAPDVSDVGAKRIVDLLKGTRFERAYDTDPEALDELVSHTVAGSGSLFCEAVEGWLAAADGFDLENCLVRIEARGAAGRLIARAQKRSRDAVWTIKGDRIWAFLLGCPRAAAPRVMQRMFSGPSHEPLPAWFAEFRPERILAQLQALRAA